MIFFTYKIYQGACLPLTNIFLPFFISLLDFNHLRSFFFFFLWYRLFSTLHYYPSLFIKIKWYYPLSLFNIDSTLLVIVAERFNIAITGTTEVKAWWSAGFWHCTETCGTGIYFLSIIFIYRCFSFFLFDLGWRCYFLLWVYCWFSLLITEKYKYRYEIME